MRAVPVFVPRGQVIIGNDGGGIGAQAVEAGADQLVVAIILGELLPRDAFPEPIAGRRAVGQIAFAAVASGVAKIKLVGEAGVLGPDAGIDDADDDVFAGRILAAQLIPETATVGQAQEVGRIIGFREASFVGPDMQDVGTGRQRGRLGSGQLSGKAVEADVVIVEFAIYGANLDEGVIVAAVEIGHVAFHVTAVWIDLLAFLRTGSSQSRDVTVIGDNRIVNHLDYINRRLGLIASNL